MEMAVSFIVLILVATSCWLLSSLFMLITYNHYVKKIENSQSAAESCRYRKRYRNSMYIEKIIFFITSIIGVFCIFEFITHDLLHLDTPGTPERYVSHPTFWIILGLIQLYYFILRLTNTITNPTIAVTALTKEDINGDYVLFLRGFGCDNYLPENYQDKNKKSFFSEHKFCKCLSFITDAIAIGRPEELINPGGASRVYLDNATWKDDVLHLIKMAKCVIILVNDKEHCIWEIQQAERFKEKTVYIINNTDKFRNVKSVLPTTHLSQYVDPRMSFVSFYKDGNLTEIPLENNKNGYWRVIKSISHLL